jgi:hypothetical protein
MALGGAAGAIYGAQKERHKEAHALLYGGLGAAGGAAAGLLLFNPDQELESMKQKAKRLEDELKTFKENSAPPLLSAEGNTLLTAPVPDDLRALVSPGKWRRYKLDQWVQDQSQQNVWFRQTEMFEVIPPQMNQ